MKNHLKYLPKPVLHDIVQGCCIPIIGAGFSKNADLPVGLKMPSWADLGKFFSDQIPDYPFSTPIDSISAFCHEFSRAKLVEELGTALHINESKPGSAHISFANVPFDMIITTNFDFLLEKAYEQTNISYRPIIDEDQLSISTAKYDRVILKIHGDLNHPGRLIVTEEDYDNFIDKYPLLSTYISNLLISRTPLLIGYSLDDPDFRQLWQIIGNRLGKLRRPAYAILINPNRVDIARYERRGVKVIALSGNKSDYGTALSFLFQEIKEYWDEELIKNSTVMSDETLSELSLPRDSQTRLCYFAVPVKLHSYYKDYVFPIAERFGFTPITAMDVLSPGDNYIAKISTLIDRATLVVADASTPAALSELGMATAKRRRIIIIAEKGSKIPLDIDQFAYIQRSNLYKPPDQKFISALEKIFKKFSKELEEKLYDEPRRLLEKKEYRAAVISSFSLLETELREISMINASDEQKVFRFTLGRTLEMAKRYELISPNEFRQLKDWWNIRNRLVHGALGDYKITPKDASEIVNGIMQILQNIRKKDLKNEL